MNTIFRQWLYYYYEIPYFAFQKRKFEDSLASLTILVTVDTTHTDIYFIPQLFFYHPLSIQNFTLIPVEVDNTLLLERISHQKWALADDDSTNIGSIQKDKTSTIVRHNGLGKQPSLVVCRNRSSLLGSMPLWDTQVLETPLEIPSKNLSNQVLEIAIVMNMAG